MKKQNTYNVILVHSCPHNLQPDLIILLDYDVLEKR